MNARRPARGPRLAALPAAGWLLCLALAVTAQEPLGPPPLPVDPTPLAELLTLQESARVTGAKNKAKKLVEIYLDISDARLDAAYAAIKGNDAPTAERELDVYNKAIREAVNIALAKKDGRRGMTKKIEQRLFDQIKTLELVERLFPFERVAFAEAALRNARQVRVQALNETFASGDILDEPDEQEKKKRPQGQSQVPRPRLSMALAAAQQSRSPKPSSSLIPGDYLNEEEDDHVRTAQDPDARMKAFMKIADRRLAALTGEKPDPNDKKAMKRAEEELREWGPLPEVGRADLLRHYARAIDEAMTKLEDAYERNPKASAIPKALAILHEATERHLRTLRALEPQMSEESESRALKDAIEQASRANEDAARALKK